MPEIDLAACLGCLEQHERHAVRTLADTFGLHWTACPPLKRLVVHVAVLRLSADQHSGLSELGRLREAAWSLGQRDEGAKLAAAISRSHLRWLLEADTTEADKMSGEDAA